MKRFVVLMGVLSVCGGAGCGGEPRKAPGERNVEPTLETPSLGDTSDATAPTQPAGPAAPWYSLDATLTIHEMQTAGSHNSYHVAPAAPLSPELVYTMPPLPVQLAAGMRAFELDLHYYEGAFWVYHLPVDDAGTTCPRLQQCLGELAAWSAAHPGHHLLTVFLEFKDAYDSDKIRDHLGELDAELLTAFPRDRVLFPDDVVQDSPDLATAVGSRGWPTLGATRGKIMFVMWSFGDIPYAYTGEGQGFAGRPLFVASTDAGWRHAMILGMDTAQDQEAQIESAVAGGYLVRTRSDDLPARGGDFPARKAAALRSGAQFVLTDYPGAGMLPGGAPSRCNPVTARSACTSLGVENPSLLRAPAD